MAIILDTVRGMKDAAMREEGHKDVDFSDLLANDWPD